MGNAIDDVKNIAKYKTNLEDGVAEMVERLVLKKNLIKEGTSALSFCHNQAAAERLVSLGEQSVSASGKE